MAAKKSKSSNALSLVLIGVGIYLIIMGVLVDASDLWRSAAMAAGFATLVGGVIGYDNK